MRHAEEQQGVITRDHRTVAAARALLLAGRPKGESRQKPDQWLLFFLGVIASIPTGVLVNFITPK
ncbi:hypothetical protein [Planotetraspora sp. GP83]|uniref:hypothetical protein n=1 Tax=Planotetraspora sp. GP83 TaxID=3156264 RepID=UPI0035117234